MCFYYLFHPAGGKRCTGTGGNKQVGFIGILWWFRTNGQIFRDGVKTSAVKINHALFIPLAQYSKGVIPDIQELNTDQLRKTNATVKQNGDDTIIAFTILAFNGFQQVQAFIQSKVFWKTFALGRNLQLFHGVFL